MASTDYYFTGEAQWAHVYEPKDTYDKRSKEWTINVKLDEESAARFSDSECQLKVKDGFVNFRRPTRKLIKDDLVEYDPPAVLDSTNAPMTAKIGNGSKVTVKVSIYDTRKGMGHTLQAVRVDELVPYGENSVSAPADMVPF